MSQRGRVWLLVFRVVRCQTWTWGQTELSDLRFSDLRFLSGVLRSQIFRYGILRYVPKTLNIRDWNLDPFVALYSVGAGQVLCMMKQFMVLQQQQIQQAQKRPLQIADATEAEVEALKKARIDVKKLGTYKQIAAMELARNPTPQVMELAAQQLLKDIDDKRLHELAAAMPYDAQASVLMKSWQERKTSVAADTSGAPRKMFYPAKVLQMAASQFLKGYYEQKLKVFSSDDYKDFRDTVLSRTEDRVRQTMKEANDRELAYEKGHLKDEVLAKLERACERAGVPLATLSDSEQEDEQEEQEEEASDSDASEIYLPIDEV